ncbi:type VI secretion system contractile sheath large subunit [Marinomonas mediterranea]|jgi:type VI secretion protein, EvpB/VC_A0108 family|uniref:Type VI secretion protein, EvpB/VC_A0108 family n=1 Tax=Marinomonas mediterranea (strain ATCC 700492 / JCM 21426 / NBRC 103028 / MMB-1) TaxID=717774 RepID=F2JVZ4_MARM1|nr:type VI secretion system contractile sheath large subunit [Marinomonas mediterranea]ADZ92882.1 type VI secretion protein, EvpB/VC_A0108 family [Marinomonas mediterranea MMB-1]WCN10815.1 type VI secretion system contractile sheath large subunit [Marinomonas mediterranea]WCN14872.1 type VI secretion system contractile sheath large subunit [Marinomonas mediterranea]WCN18904.1 type VI secretion system contractile sheath large subunit [Marinomonas mediterranea MMB-1]
MSVQESVSTSAASVEFAEDSVYQRLCGLIQMEPVDAPVDINKFQNPKHMAEVETNERITAALKVFFELALESGTQIERIDKTLLDQYIATIDDVISAQLDEVLHHKDFQKVESSWRGLKFLVDRTDFKANMKIELLDCTKEALREDFEESPDTTQSGLFDQIYTQEYDTPGGEPVTSMIANFEFDRTGADVELLTEVSKVASAAHCPFISAIGPEFFDKESIEDIPKIQDIGTYMDRAEYIRWKGFRETEDSRYVGLVFPRFLLRLPYGEENPIRSFNYREGVTGEQHNRYLWGNSAFAFAANMTRSFKKNGWTVNIRGPESGGKLDKLPIHFYQSGRGTESKIPTEVLISETKELELADHGFIPLSYYKNSDYACFFSANSTQRPLECDEDADTANARINSRLPYIFLVSRIAQYLKILQRENIGSLKSRQDLENELNAWLQSLVTKMNNPEPELAATHPLKDGRVFVSESEDNPGYYFVNMHVQPHFQVEGVDVKLSLVSQMPEV